MKLRLIIMRHAKSSWDELTLKDHERPLNKRGRRDAPRVARALQRIGWVPDLIISSDSMRTSETFTLMLPEFEKEPRVMSTRNFYGAGALEIVEELEGVEDAPTVLVLGHNPGWENAIHYFCKEDHTMTTANAALLEAHASDWIEATSRDGFRFVAILKPKELDE